MSLNNSVEKLCLKWNDFEQNISSAFGILRQDKDFVDVTLVSEDGQQLDLHKVVLASSSPFFLQLLKKSNPTHHPLIFMRGVTFEDLAAIVDFLYLGEANILEENLDGFLTLAGELELKGLSGRTKGENKDKAASPPSRNKKGQKDNKSKKEKSQESYIFRDLNIPSPQTDLTIQSPKTEGAVDQVGEEIRSMMEKSKVNFDSARRPATICKVCGKEGQASNIWNHIEAIHLTSDVSYTCDLCGKISRSRNGMFLHKSKCVNRK